MLNIDKIFDRSKILEKLAVEELLKSYERLAKKSQCYLTDEDDGYKEKVKGELLKRLE